MAPTRGPDKGELFESRVARLLFAEGAFVRRRVNLDAHYGERFTITDVDVLAIYFSPTLDMLRVAGECKTTEAKNSPSAGDRLLWASGLSRLAGASEAFVAIAKRARDTERNIASLVGSSIIDIRDLERREQVLTIGSGDALGPHDPALNSLRTAARDLGKADEEMRRIFVFVTSELWLTPAIPALKKALGAARRLGERWSSDLPDRERSPLEWMFAECVTGAIVGLTRLAALGYRQPEDVNARYLQERFAEGLADYRALREISSQVDKVLMSALQRLNVDPSRAVELMGLFEPKAPSYLDPMTELVERLARHPASTAHLARLADSRFATFLGSDGSVERWIPAVDGVARSLRLVATFLEGQVRVPAGLVEPLRREPPRTDPQSAAATEDGSASTRGTDRHPSEAARDAQLASGQDASRDDEASPDRPALFEDPPAADR